MPLEAGIDTRSSGPYFGRHLQFYYVSNENRIQGGFVPNNTKKPKEFYKHLLNACVREVYSP